MNNFPNSFSVCICTYKRPHLLKLLLEDISRQSIQPDYMIVVDGDGTSGEVRQLLLSPSWVVDWKTLYLPSNHGNLAYQRYLGWCLANQWNSEMLLYLDDDIRIHNRDAIKSMLYCFQDSEVVGVTVDTTRHDIVDNIQKQQNQANESRSERDPKTASFSINNKRIKPGGLTPVGNRKFPIKNGHDYVDVEWLQGRVMFYRMVALAQDCFSEDLFALDHIRCDLGEDTFLSRQVGAKGKLLLGFGLGIEHPNADTPKCYPTESRKFGYAVAYSRRFLNDHYRVTEPPRFSDRLALLKTYVGNHLLNLIKTIFHLTKHNFAYGWGYFCGSMRGIFQKPTAKNLTPHINWWADAEEVLQQVEII